MTKRRVLEVRVHGIANAPPAEMLGTTDDKITKSNGDDFGSFWTLAKPKATPAWRAGIREEAYSWGNQARSGASALVLIGRAVVHLAWLFVLPFGLCNLAYWARRDIPGDAPNPTFEKAESETNEEPGPQTAPGSGSPRLVWDGGRGAVAIRLFALLQTLFYTAGFMSVAVELIAAQCYRGDPQQVCAALPQWLDIFKEWTTVQRAALFSLVPILVMLLIYLIGLRARGSFNPNRDEERDAEARESEEAHHELARVRGAAPTATNPSNHPPAPTSGTQPLLATKGFWRRSRLAQTTERAHFAGAISLVLFLLTLDALTERVSLSSGVDLWNWLATGATAAPLAFWGMALSGLLLVGTVVVVAMAGLRGGRWSMRGNRATSTILLAIACTIYVGWILLVIFGDATNGEASDDKLDGLSVAPGVIATLCALIAVSSLSWGYHNRFWISTGLLAVAFASVIAAEVAAPDWLGLPDWLPDLNEQRLLLSMTAIVLVAIATFVVGYLWHGKEVKAARDIAGWHGNGAAVAMLIALFSSMVITSLLVIGTHAWLSTSSESPDTRDLIWRSPPVGPTLALVPPDFYERFAITLLGILGALLVLAAATAATALWRFPRFTVPMLLYPDGTTDAQKKADENRSGTPAPDPKYPLRVLDARGRKIDLDVKDRAVVSARRLAALAHRGEPMMAALAILTAAALVPLTVPWFAEFAARWELWEPAQDAAAWVLGLLALAAVAWVVTNAVTSTERPLGLVWDIICFFPRAGHPFTPPCYAERAVPELEERLEDWFKDDAAGERAAVISAHSMGATIAVATIFSMNADGAPISKAPQSEEMIATTDGSKPIDRVALLTYGVQLRAYFSRFFPEVFGPQVLGTRGTLRPALFGKDPWARQIRVDWNLPAKRPKRGAVAEPAPPQTTLELKSSREPEHESSRDSKEPPPTLVEALGGDLDTGKNPRWLSLWRRTDYLGFPVNSYNPNDKLIIDRGASERAPRTYLWTVARHNDYQGTLQYTAAREDLVKELLPQPVPSRTTPGGTALTGAPLGE